MNDIRYWITLVEGRENRQWENDNVVVYHDERIVYHTTNENAARSILKAGFKTGKDLNINEKRGAIYFADEDVNPGIYARNKQHEPYHGQATAMIPANLKGLRLLNMTYRENGEFVNFNQYKSIVPLGDFDAIPVQNIDGAISFLDDGRIYQVAVRCETANLIIIKRLII